MIPIPREEQLQLIRERCVSANPEIEKVFIVASIIAKISGTDGWRAVAIKGRPIHLADVLLAIPTTLHFKKLGNQLRLTNEDALEWWDLRYDDLTQQDDYTISFLYQLLK